jgi:hypothetical protein
LAGDITKGLALILTNYPEEFQEKGLLALKAAAEAKGSPLHPNEGRRILRRTAQEEGVSPIKSKKGKRIRNYEEMVISNLKTEGEKFLKSIREFLSSDKEKMAGTSAANQENIMRLVNRIKPELNKVEERLLELD